MADPTRGASPEPTGLQGEHGSTSILGDELLDLGDALNAVLDKGAVIHGDVTIAVADVDLIRLSLGLLLRGIATAEDRTGPARGPAGRPAGPSAGPLAGSLAASLGPLLTDVSATQRAEQAAQAPVQGGDAVAPGSVEPVPVAAAPAQGVSPREATLNSVAQGLPERINADVAGVESGLARLVLTLIEVLRKVLEHQAVRRMEGGRLSAEEVERLGLALSRLHDRMQDLKRVFGLTDQDLQIDLGPLGRLR